MSPISGAPGGKRKRSSAADVSVDSTSSPVTHVSKKRRVMQSNRSKARLDSPVALNRYRALLQPPSEAAVASPRLAGVRKMFIAAKDDNTDEGTLELRQSKHLLKTPKRAGSTPQLRLYKALLQERKQQASPRLAGVRDMMREPRKSVTPRFVGMRKMFKEPKTLVAERDLLLQAFDKAWPGPLSPRLRGIREMLSSPARSPASPNLDGLLQLMESPEQVEAILQLEKSASPELKRKRLSSPVKRARTTKRKGEEERVVVVVNTTKTTTRGRRAASKKTEKEVAVVSTEMATGSEPAPKRGRKRKAAAAEKNPTASQDAGEETTADVSTAVTRVIGRKKVVMKVSAKASPAGRRGRKTRAAPEEPVLITESVLEEDMHVLTPVKEVKTRGRKAAVTSSKAKETKGRKKTTEQVTESKEEDAEQKEPTPKPARRGARRAVGKLAKTPAKPSPLATRRGGRRKPVTVAEVEIVHVEESPKKTSPKKATPKKAAVKKTTSKRPAAKITSPPSSFFLSPSAFLAGPGFWLSRTLSTCIPLSQGSSAPLRSHPMS